MSITENHDDRPASRNWTTTWLIGLLIVEMTGMGLYTYFDVKRQMEPSNLAAKAEEAIERNYPEIRKKIVQNVEENATTIAEQISDEAVGSSPETRQWLERMVKRQLGYGLDRATAFSAEGFRGFLQENRQRIEEAFQRLEQAPEQARQMVLELESRMEQQWGVALESEARAALELHRQLNRKLQRLAGDAPLEPRELLERRIVRIFRTLIERELP